MEKPKINYDVMSDTLYVSFEPGTKKVTGIELNEHILLTPPVSDFLSVSAFTPSKGIEESLVSHFH